MRLIYVALTLLVPTVNAASLDQKPHLSDLRHYVSTPDPKLHVIIGKADPSGKLFILVSDDHRRWVPDLLPPSTETLDGAGDLNFYLQTGERIFIPGPRSFDESPRMMFKNHRAPETLERIKLDSAALRRLHLPDYFTYTVQYRLDIAAPPGHSGPALKNQQDLILVGIPAWPDVFAPAEKFLRTADRKKVRDLLAIDTTKSQKHLFVVTHDLVEEIRGMLSPDSFRSIDVIDLNATAAKDNLEWIADIMANKTAFAGINHGLRGKSGQRNWSPRFLVGMLDELHDLYERLDVLISADDRLHGLRWMTKRLSDTAHQIQDLIVEMDDAAVYCLIPEHADAVGGSGLHLFDRPAPRSGESWFKVWLSQERWRFALGDSLGHREYTRPLAHNFIGEEHVEVFHPHLGVSSRMLRLYNEDSEPEMAISGVPSKRLPTLMLGLSSDVTDFKRQLVEFIIVGDKSAQKMAEWWSKNEPYRRPSADVASRSPIAVTGDLSLHQFIAGLNFPPVQPKPLGFSMPAYRLAVTEVFQTLLDTAETSIINPGTYASILDSALEAVDLTRRELDLEKLGQHALASATFKLQSTVARSLLAGLARLRTLQDPSLACSLLLAPSDRDGNESGLRD